MVATDSDAIDVILAVVRSTIAVALWIYALDLVVLLA